MGTSLFGVSQAESVETVGTSLFVIYTIESEKGVTIGTSLSVVAVSMKKLEKHLIPYSSKPHKHKKLELFTVRYGLVAQETC